MFAKEQCCEFALFKLVFAMMISSCQELLHFEFLHQYFYLGSSLTQTQRLLAYEPNFVSMNLYGFIGLAGMKCSLTFFFLMICWPAHKYRQLIC